MLLELYLQRAGTALMLQQQKRTDDFVPLICHRSEVTVPNWETHVVTGKDGGSHNLSH